VPATASCCRWCSACTPASGSSCSAPRPEYTEPPASAVALGDLMRSQWTAFAAGGDPGWPPYSPGRRLTRIFDDPPDVVPYPEKASLHIWDQHRFGVLDLQG
jgi:carboxylesterase type B